MRSSLLLPVVYGAVAPAPALDAHVHWNREKSSILQASNLPLQAEFISQGKDQLCALACAVIRPRAKRVLRLLKRKDITAELVNQVIHIVWPDNQIWYAAVVNKVIIIRSRSTPLLL
jgi:hypothetical protein